MTNAFLSLHFDALVIDGHCDSIGDQLERKRWLGDRASDGHVDLPRLREGGIDVQFFACYVPTPYQRHGATTHALERLDQLHLLGKVAGIAGLEGAEALDASIGVLRQFYRLGLRNLGLAWNHRNAACDGVAESRTNGGLTEFGVKVVEECNQLGILLDVSHLSSAGLTDVLAVSQQPIIASHSNARALCDHPRNLTDAQMAAIAAKGGVIGVTFVDSFLNRANPQDASLDDIVANIEYMLGVVGPEHVALGSDFDGWTLAREIKDASCYPLITQKLVERGHDAKVIRLS